MDTNFSRQCAITIPQKQAQLRGDPNGGGSPMSIDSRGQVAFLDIFDRNASYPIFARICDYLGIAEIVSLTRTCKKMSNVYQSLLSTHWDVNKNLRRFVNNPTGFRSQMAAHDALISGSLALQFFERVTWKSADLDVFVEGGQRFESLCKYITDHEGYKFDRETDRVDYAMTPIDKIWTFKRPRAQTSQPSRANGSAEDVEEDQLQIVGTLTIPMEAILAGFYSTLVINVISWNNAYSIFPLSTFIHHIGYLTVQLNEYYSACIRKYHARGWKIQPTRWQEEKGDNHPIRPIRRVGDRYTWKISLDSRGVQPSETPDMVMEYAQFGVGLVSEEDLPLIPVEPGSFHVIRTIPLRAHCLRYRYTSGSDPDWRKFVIERCDKLTRFELRKLKPEDRPRHYHETVWTQSSNLDEMQITKPEYWTYWDAEIPKWYKAWEESKLGKAVSAA